MIFVSPLPNTWYKIWVSLKEGWEHGGGLHPAPPAGLVLSGWTMSNDFDKQQRWQQTLRWALLYNMTHLIPILHEDQKYYVETLSSWRPFEDHDFRYHCKKTNQTIKTETKHLLSLSSIG